MAAPIHNSRSDNPSFWSRRSGPEGTSSPQQRCRRSNVSALSVISDRRTASEYGPAASLRLDQSCEINSSSILYGILGVLRVVGRDAIQAGLYMMSFRSVSSFAWRLACAKRNTPFFGCRKRWIPPTPPRMSWACHHSANSGLSSRRRVSNATNAGSPARRSWVARNRATTRLASAAQLDPNSRRDPG